MIIARIHADHTFRGWRAKPRKAIRLEIHAALPSDGARAIVRDLSEHGLRLETSAELTVGDHFEVELPMAEHVVAEVVWSNGASHGCKFVRPVPKAVVSAAALLSPVDGDSLREKMMPGVIDEFFDHTRPRRSDKFWYAAAALLFSLVLVALILVAGVIKSAL